jgi:hypothetical protein
MFGGFSSSSICTKLTKNNKEGNMSSYLYRVSRPAHEHIEYDEYDSYVVCAASPEEAVEIHPATKVGVKDQVRYEMINETWRVVFDDGTVDTEPAYNSGGWVSDVESLVVENIGTAQGPYMLGRVLCASFNAG